jgi:predicted alpha-1,6-mannanase (GH76 family)
LVEPGEGAFDDPAVAAEVGAVFGLAPSDLGCDPARSDEAAVLVVVVAAVGKQRLGSSPGASDTATDGRHPVEQLEQLADIVAVATGQCPGQRDAAAVYEEVVLAACPAAVNRAGTRFGAPFFAWMWLPSATARSHSSWSAA